MVEWVAAAFAAFIIFLLGVVVTAQAARARRLERARQDALRRAFDLEERLRAAEDARSSAEIAASEKEQLAAVGELSAMIAHEIRNPLTIIGNAVTTLQRKELAPADRSTLLGILTEECERLNRLAGDLLLFARPIQLELQPVSLREIVERALSLVPERPDLDVELVEPSPVGAVMADPNLLRQVFENLVNNAAQAMTHEGGSLTVRILRGEEHGAPGVDVLVEDTGEGMDTSVRDRALMPFFTTRPSGTGLGLAIVARFVQAHGGKIEIKSAAGTGTTVRVFLPESEPGFEAAQSSGELRQSGRRLKQPPAA